MTPLVTPAPPPSLADALSAFDRIVDDGASNGSISGDAAERLRNARAEVADAAEEGNRGKANRALRDLHRVIDELLADGEISPEVAASLDDAVNDIDAATG